MKEIYNDRINEERYNNQGCLMRIIKYDNSANITIQFQDKHKFETHTTYKCFVDGKIKNPYHPSVHGVGILGAKYQSVINGKTTKEYETWTHMLRRCFDKKYKSEKPTYQNVTCCEEWLYYENFYEWLHKQENFDKWCNNNKWTLDKDILIKGNKVYSPETCCLVPHNVNLLFVNKNKHRNGLFLGILKSQNGFFAKCHNPLIKKYVYLGIYPTPEEAFYVYKQYKENLIKQIAQIEYSKGNITKKCYDAMMNYEIKIYEIKITD